MTRWLTTAEAAQLLGKPSAAALRAWCKRHPGRLPMVKLGREWRTTERAIHQALGFLGRREGGHV